MHAPLPAVGALPYAERRGGGVTQGVTEGAPLALSQPRCAPLSWRPIRRLTAPPSPRFRVGKDANREHCAQVQLHSRQMPRIFEIELGALRKQPAILRFSQRLDQPLSEPVALHLLGGLPAVGPGFDPLVDDAE
jgi:hypothetical protein